MSSITTNFLEAEFTGVYNRYYSLVLHYIRFHNGAVHPEAEDIAQDIFLILWCRREKLALLTPLENYLFTMVKNRLINDTRKSLYRGRIWRRISAEPEFFADTAYPDIFGRKAERWLRAAIEGLPAEPRTAYVLRERHGLKVHEVAALMGISQAGASRKLQEAENGIRKFIGRQLM